MTDLLDRYLAAVARDLPEAQRADITAELRDELLSGIEAKEEALGRALDPDEEATLLTEFGHPLVVAGRYRRTQHLIGPEVFPFWWAGLRAGLLAVLAIYLGLVILSAISGGNAMRVSHLAAPSLTTTLVFMAGAVTLVCALAERFGKTRWLARWRPGDLPPAKARGRSRFEILFELVIGAALLLWWAGAIELDAGALNRGLSMAPVWYAWRWPIALYLAAELLVNLLALIYPGRSQLNGVLYVARNMAAAGMLAGIWQAGHFVEVAAGRIPAEAAARIEANLDKGIGVGMVSAIVILTGLAALQLWRMRQAARAVAV